MNRVQEAALAYGERGWSVFPTRPVSRGKPGWEKRPVDSWKERQCTRLTPNEIIELWRDPHRGIAVVTGPISGIVVLDTDTDEADRWVREHCAATGYTVCTGGGGLHRYYLYPPAAEVTSAAAIGGIKGLDRRAKGGYVLAPPTMHSSGRRYELDSDRPMTVYDPQWFAGLSARPSGPPLALDGQAPDVIRFRARCYVARIPSISGQSGEKQLFRAACALVRRFGLPPGEALDELRIWNGYCARPPWPDAKLRHTIRQALKYKS